DPCPSFDDEVKPRRVRRAEDRKALLTSVLRAEPSTGALPGDSGEFRVMFIGLCHREKGLFDALEAVALANRRLAATPLRLTLAVAGGFWHESERVEFEQRVRQPDLFRDGRPLVEYRGFVHGAEKQRLFRESDCLCFPTYYPAESFGLVVVEAMAWGLHVVTTRWQTVPELLPPGYSGLVAPQSPAELATALVSMVSAEYDARLRRRFLECLTERRFIDNVRGALAAVKREG
ncbi:MAG: glycosyltransferase family 4 protein, partial [Limisphaerales bacterium]